MLSHAFTYSLLKRTLSARFSFKEYKQFKPFEL